jgi:hypothetical protein
MCLLLGALLALSGRLASELALAGAEPWFAPLMVMGATAWFAGLALLMAGILSSAWLFLVEGVVLLSAAYRRFCRRQRVSRSRLASVQAFGQAGGAPGWS